MNDETLKSQFDKFEKEQIKHNTNLTNLTGEVHSLNTRIDRDFYKFPSGALFKVAGLARSSAIHWAIIFVILGVLTWMQYVP